LEVLVVALEVAEDSLEVFVEALEVFVVASGVAEVFAIITAVASAGVDPGVSSNKETCSA
jgi:hypothetical protein